MKIEAGLVLSCRGTARRRGLCEPNPNFNINSHQSPMTDLNLKPEAAPLPAVEVVNAGEGGGTASANEELTGSCQPLFPIPCVISSAGLPCIANHPHQGHRVQAARQALCREDAFAPGIQREGVNRGRARDALCVELSRSSRSANAQGEAR